MRANSISINKRPIGNKYAPYIIAEMSANHNGSIEKAFELIRQAKKSGANAVKIQTYTADTLTIKSDKDDFKIKSGLWSGKTLYDLSHSPPTPWDWHKALFEEAKAVGITLFSSPFDCSAVDLLEDLNTPAYKIASFEAIDLPLIHYVASTGKPIIISTGMASLEEIEEAVDIAKQAGCDELALLHCVSGYPAPAADYHLNTIPNMMEHFGLVTGLSDHTLDNTTAITSIALGASIIEKHFTLDRKGGGPDDSFSLEPDDLVALCRDAKTAWSALGNVNYDKKNSEKENTIFRRSLYFVNDIESGEKVTEKHVKSIRPGYGLAPKYLQDVIGKKVLCDIKKGTAVSWDKIES